MDALGRVEVVKDLVEEAVDRGVTSVEQVHQAIAAAPFAVLEALGVPDPLGIRERQRRIIGIVYGAVREANRHVGTLLSDGFEAFEDGRRAAGAPDDDPTDGTA